MRLAGVAQPARTLEMTVPPGGAYRNGGATASVQSAAVRPAPAGAAAASTSATLRDLRIDDRLLRKQIGY
jgi:hypothetical protein